MKQLIKAIDIAKLVSTLVMVFITVFFTRLIIIDWYAHAYNGDVLTNVLATITLVAFNTVSIVFIVMTTIETVREYRMNKAMFMQDSITR